MAVLQTKKGDNVEHPNGVPYEQTMEVRLILDDDLVESLKKRMKTKNATDVIREGIGLLDWATEEIGQNRVIISIGEDGADPKQIETPGLRQARPKRAVASAHG